MDKIRKRKIIVIVVLLIFVFYSLIEYTDTEQIIFYLKEYSKEFAFLIAGAVLGFFGSLAASYLIESLKIFFTENTLKYYVGKYKTIRKDGAESHILEVEIKLKKGNVFNLNITSKSNGKIKGVIIIDDYSKTYGRGVYNHIDNGKEHMSGFYDIILIRPGFIHAKCTWVNIANKDVIDQYIWEKI